MSSKVMNGADAFEKTKKHLRSVLISEKGGVALDRLERDYRELVSSFSYVLLMWVMFLWLITAEHLWAASNSQKRP